jgi:hypothetical protein
MQGTIPHQSRNENGLGTPSISRVTEEDMQDTARILRSATTCQEAFEIFGGKSPHRARLRTSLDRWQLAGFPRPEFQLVGLSVSEWLPEFERFLDSLGLATSLPA